MRLTINDILERQVALTLYRYFKSLFDGLVNIETASEKKLLIELQMMREAYDQREFTEVGWVPSEQNPASVMAKENPSSELNIFMTNNRLNIQQKS